MPSGKAEKQALGSREQVLDDQSRGGMGVLIEETQEEEKERDKQGWLRRSPRKMAQRSRAGSGASSLMGLRDRVNESLVGSCVAGPGKEQS